MVVITMEQLIWDEWNIEHIARHELTPDEVEAVCAGDAFVSETYSGRLRLIEPTYEGNMVTVIIAPKSTEKFYPVTARPASRKERVLYKQWKGGEEPYDEDSK
jgi:uncharacterized protein